jgi:hypothetical protein
MIHKINKKIKLLIIVETYLKKLQYKLDNNNNDNKINTVKLKISAIK